MVNRLSGRKNRRSETVKAFKGLKGSKAPKDFRGFKGSMAFKGVKGLMMCTSRIGEVQAWSPMVGACPQLATARPHTGSATYTPIGYNLARQGFVGRTLIVGKPSLCPSPLPGTTSPATANDHPSIAFASGKSPA